MALCPVCFSTLGLWSDDPVLCTPSLSIGVADGLTIIKPTHIIELQNQRNLDEIAAGLTPTVWTHIDNTNLYQVLKQCIKELRTSIENILTAISSDKDHFFNYDKDGNYMGTTQIEWHDPDLDIKLYQIKAIHIEDLRHPVPAPVASWMEDWVGATYSKTDSIYSVPPSAPSDYEYSISFSGRKSWLIDTFLWEMGTGGSPLSGSFSALDYSLTTSSGLILTTDLHTKVIADNTNGGSRRSRLAMLIKTDFASGTERNITVTSTLSIIGNIGVTLNIISVGLVYFAPGTHSLGSYSGKTISTLYIGDATTYPTWTTNYSVQSYVPQNVPPYPPLVTSTDEDEITPGFSLTKISITNLIV